MKIGILKETKQPPDRRVPLTPGQIKKLKLQFPQHEFSVQSSLVRVYSDEEYREAGIEIVDEVSDCDILLGVKELSFGTITPGKTYLFFSHTAKEQSQNQELLSRLAEMKCTLIDYEYLTQNNVRLVAFGYWAGIVGAYMALQGYGLQSGLFELKPPQHCKDLKELKNEIQKVKSHQAMHIVITGEGRVASGSSEILMAAGIKRINPEEFLRTGTDENLFCHAGPQHYTKHFQDKAFDFNHFIQHPNDFESDFFSYTHKANMLIACHYWDKDSPHLFTALDLQNPDFKIRTISDISCDIPGPIPTTLRASTIDLPFYGVKRANCSESEPFDSDQITVTAVDNLPSALPRDASEDFGNALINSVIPELLSPKSGDIIENASILKNGFLTKKYSYLENYLRGSK